MKTRYRRVRPTRTDELASAAVSFLVGAGAAAVTFYLTRLILSREPLAVRELPETTGRRSLPGAGRAADRGR